jgi:hypothetical protein
VGEMQKKVELEFPNTSSNMDDIPRNDVCMLELN